MSRATPSRLAFSRQKPTPLSLLRSRSASSSGSEPRSASGASPKKLPVLCSFWHHRRHPSHRTYPSRRRRLSGSLLTRVLRPSGRQGFVRLSQRLLALGLGEEVAGSLLGTGNAAFPTPFGNSYHDPSLCPSAARPPRLSLSSMAALAARILSTKLPDEMRHRPRGGGKRAAPKSGRGRVASCATEWIAGSTPAMTTRSGTKRTYPRLPILHYTPPAALHPRVRVATGASLRRAGGAVSDLSGTGKARRAQRGPSKGASPLRAAWRRARPPPGL